MYENITIFGIGTGIGILGQIVLLPILITLLLAFFSGLLAYAGKLVLHWLIKKIKNRKIK